MINEISINSSNTIELSRSELLSWLNDLLGANVTKIEQLGTGAVYCQLLDLLYPGKVQLAKVNTKAKNQYEYINNFKILQQYFTKFGITRNIDVQKLIKCKYQDNLQFLQWFKKIFDNHYSSKIDPDASMRRSVSDNQISFTLQKQNKRPTRALNFSVADNQKNQPLNEVPKLHFSKEVSRLAHSTTSRSKNEEKFKKQTNASTKPSTQRINIGNQSLSVSILDTQTQRTQVIVQHEQNQGTITKQPYYSPSKYLEKEHFYKGQNEKNSNCDEERQFYLKKFKEIQHLLEIWEDNEHCLKLVNEIRKVIFVTPEIKDWKVDDQTGEVVFLADQKSHLLERTSEFNETNEQNLTDP